MIFLPVGGFRAHRRLLVVHPFMIGGDALQDHDADRFVDQGAPARLLAGVRADPAADRRDRHVAADGAERLVETVFLDLLDIGGDIDMGRAAVGAGGGQLVMIDLGRLCCALAAHERQVIVTEVLNRIEDRLGGGHAQGALAAFQQRSQPGQGVEIPLLAIAGDDLRQGIHHHPGAALAGGALGAAVLLLHALHVLGNHGDHVDLAVIDDEPAPPHKGADAPFVEVVLGELENGGLRLAALAVVNDLAAPTGKNHVGQNVPPVQVAPRTRPQRSSKTPVPPRFPAGVRVP